ETFAIGEVIVTDTVSYKELIVGKEYTVKGVLMNKATNTPLLIDGKEVKAEKTFTADTKDGTVELEFKFDASELETTEVVVFEKLFKGDVEVTSHEDINDEAQTVIVRKPEIKTLAKVDGEKETFAIGEVIVTDTVSYKELIVGKEYTVKGVLMNKATNTPLLIDGKEVKAEKTFTADTKDGTVELEFKFDASELETTEVVVFEKLFKGDVEVTSHEDINDEAQTVIVRKPEIKTLAEVDGEKETFAKGEVVITDKVAYKDLIVGKEYTVKGVLMNKATNTPLLIDGKEVKAEKTFIADTKDGIVELEFKFDASKLETTEVVVFEKLFKGDVEVTSHEDINDEAQTVMIKDANIATHATVNGEKETEAQKDVEVLDRVHYSGLIVGKEYTLKGVLMDKATNSKLIVGGKEVTSEVKFVAEKSEGMVEMKFTFDATGLGGKEVVVFEKLYKDGEEIAAHEDINDAAQTVFIKKPKEVTPPTGDGTRVGLMLTVMAMSMAAFVLFERKRRIV
ncbi:MAG: VaFE repeat-containing surface-anchored protein, partial [Tissierellia bacterium]|nr:VaFE repeat-containing surface-anchored protein [Tissierellia bacterium]